MAKLSELDKLDLELMRQMMSPPCTADRRNTLTAANLANIEAIRNGGVPVAVALPDTMELPVGMSVEAYLKQLMSVG